MENVKLLEAKITYDKDVVTGGKITSTKAGKLKIKVTAGDADASEVDMSKVDTSGLTWIERESGTDSYLSTVAYCNNLLVVTGLNGTILTSPDGKTWASSSGASGSLYARAVYNNGLYISASDSNVLFKSTDGASWTGSIDLTDGPLSCAYGNNIFLIGCRSYCLYTSPNGIDWSKVTTPIYCIRDIIYADNQFVACGNDGMIMRSLSGIDDWTQVISGTSELLFAITYGKGLYVIVGCNGVMLRSQDGIHWSSVSGFGNSWLMGVTYGGGLFVVVNASGIMYSSIDGINWKTINSPVSLSITAGVNQLYYSKELKCFCVVGAAGKIYTADWRTPGIITWNGTTNTIIEGKELPEISVSAGEMILYTCDNVKISDITLIYEKESEETYLAGGKITSTKAGKLKLAVDKVKIDPNDLKWKDVSNYYDAANLGTKITNFSGNLSTVRALDDNRVWVGSNNGYLAYSSDGENWYLISGSQRGDNYENWIFGIAYEPSKGYVLGTWNAGGISYSADGALGSWSIKSGVGGNIYNTSYGNGKFVIGTLGYNISYSSDGKNLYFAKNSNGGTQIEAAVYYDIIYGDKFVAVGNDGYTVYSSDGETWYAGNKASVDYLFSIAYGDGKYIASSYTDLIGISSDGQSWDFSKTVSSLGMYRYNHICYGAGCFLIVEGGTQYVWASIDKGESWTLLNNQLGTSVFPEIGTRICYSKDLKKFFVGCCSGKIYSADWSGEEGSSITWNGSKIEITENTELAEINISAGETLIFDSENVKLISARVTYDKEVITGGRIISTKAGKLKIKVNISEDQEIFSGYEVNLEDINLTWTKATDFTDHNEVNTSISGSLYSVKWLEDNRFWAVGYPGIMLWSDDGKKWHYLSSGSRGDGCDFEIYTVSYGDGKYIAAAYDAKLLYSEEGNIWSKLTGSVVPGDYSYCTAYGNGKFAVGMANGYTAYSNSEDGTWSLGTKSGSYWYDVIYADNQFVMVGEAGYAAYSQNGMDWYLGTGYGLPNFLTGVAFRDGIYVATGGSGTVYVSNDGREWKESQPSTIGTSYVLRGVAGGAGIFLTVANYGEMFASHDGLTWKKLSLKPSDINTSFGARNHLAYSDRLRKFVVIGYGGNIYHADWPYGKVIWNDNTHIVTKGKDLPEVSVSAGGTISYTCDNIKILNATLEYQEKIGKGRVTMPKAGKLIIKATPLEPKLKPAGAVDVEDVTVDDVKNLNWEDVSNFYDASNPETKITGFTQNWQAISIPGDGKIWAGNNQGGYLAYSMDSQNWYLTYGSNRGDDWATYIWQVSYGEGRYVAAAHSAKLLYSFDNGSLGTWNKFDPGGSNWGYCTAYGNGTFILGMYGGYTRYFKDGTWYAGNTLGKAWYDVVYARNRFVMVGEYGYTAYSDNGQSWDLGSKSNNYLDALAYGNGKYIAVGDSGTVGVSNDGKVWDFTQPGGIGTNYNLRGVAYGEGVWLVAAYDYKYIWASVDNGETWTKLNNELTHAVFNNRAGNKIAYSDTLKKFIVCCKSGKIDTADWGASCSNRLKILNLNRGYNLWDKAKTIEIKKEKITDKDEAGNYYIDLEYKNISLDLTYESTYTYTLACVKSGAKNDLVVVYDKKNNDETNRTVKLVSSSELMKYQSSDFLNTPDEENEDFYYYKLPVNTLKYSLTLTGQVTETVYDLIDFKNGQLFVNGALSFAIDGNNQYGLFSVSTSNAATLSTKYKGDITLSVAPAFAVDSGTIQLKSGANTDVQTISSVTTLKISRSDMIYSSSAQYYYIDMDLKDLIVLQAKLLNPDPIVVYPEIKRASTIDFTYNGSKPNYNSSLISFGKSYNGTLADTTCYDKSSGYWYTSGLSNSFFDMQPYSKNWSFVTFLDESAEPSDLRIYYSINKNNTWRQLLYVPGQVRLVFDADQNNYRTAYVSYGKHIFINGGYTQPINMVLYNYMGNPVNTDNYVRPDNDFNRTALKKVTTDVCAKLKSDHGDNLRIYVIKYRKQEQYNVLLRNGNAAHKNLTQIHDYSAINACASDGYLYEAENESELKEQLNAIASDIKDWADYEPAKLIE